MISIEYAKVRLAQFDSWLRAARGATNWRLVYAELH
jgi:hypothetical protein